MASRVDESPHIFEISITFSLCPILRVPRSWDQSAERGASGDVPSLRTMRSFYRGLPCWLRPSRKMLMAALVSLSRTAPQCTHVCVRSDKSLCGPSSRHCEQICDVLYGFTKMTVRPALAALTTHICVNMPHPASCMLLFNPAFALAPFGTYFPSSSCFGFGRFVRLAVRRSSKAMIWYWLTN